MGEVNGTILGTNVCANEELERKLLNVSRLRRAAKRERRGGDSPAARPQVSPAVATASNIANNTS